MVLCFVHCLGASKEALTFPYFGSVEHNFAIQDF